MPYASGPTRLALVLFLLVAPPRPAGGGTAAARLDRIIPRTMRAARLPGLSAVVVRDGTVVWSRAFGFADVERRVPVESGTMFMLASVSKTVTGVALMRLVEEGALALDAAIDPLLAFPVRNPRFADQPITARMLLTHTSSIADGPRCCEDYYVAGDSPIPLATFVQAYFTPGSPTWAAGNFLAAAPGTRAAYSNLGIALAGVLIERAAGASFEQVCADRIFVPLGMRDTAWRLASLDATRVALPYSYDRRRHTYRSRGQYGYPDIPDGALRTTAPELAKFLVMFMQGGTSGGARILDPASVAAMATVQSPAIDPAQGLVWYYQRFGGRRLLGHTGADAGVSTAMFFDPETAIGIIVLANGDDGADRVLGRILPRAPRL